MLREFQNVLRQGDVQLIIESTIGQVIISVLAIALLLILVVIGSKSLVFKTKRLTYSAIAIAIATVLSQFKIIEFPQGGSVTPFSMLFIILIGYWFGPAQGIISGIVYGLVQLTIGGWVVHPIQLLLDYPIAFGALGFAGYFKNSENGLMKGVLFATFGRFIFHFISGIVFFAEYTPEGFNVITYSIAYNIAYIGIEAFLTAIILVVPAFNIAMKHVKKSAIAE